MNFRRSHLDIVNSPIFMSCCGEIIKPGSLRHESYCAARGSFTSHAIDAPEVRQGELLSRNLDIVDPTRCGRNRKIVCSQALQMKLDRLSYRSLRIFDRGASRNAAR